MCKSSDREGPKARYGHEQRDRALLAGVLGRDEQ